MQTKSSARFSRYQSTSACMNDWMYRSLRRARVDSSDMARPSREASALLVVQPEMERGIAAPGTPPLRRGAELLLAPRPGGATERGIGVRKGVGPVQGARHDSGG